MMKGALKRAIATYLAIFLFVGTGFMVPAKAAEPTDPGPKTGAEQLIVKLKPGAQIQGLTNKYKEVVQTKKGKAKQKENSRLYGLQVASGKSAALLERLKHDPSVELAQWNYLYEPDATPNDTSFSSQYAHTMTGVQAAWDTETGDSSVTIAIIGTGVKWDHPDLAANIWSNTDETDANGIDDDGNGYIDDIRGWDFGSSDNNPTDPDGHDTSVAGVAAAVTNNSLGIAGVCWTCQIMPLRVTYTTLEVAEAIDYAVDNGAKIINMSFGSYDVTKYGPDSIVEDAVNDAVASEVLVIATAGNDSITTKRYPGAYDNVIGVASTDGSDARSGFSNWGEWVDVAAPGTSVLSTIISGSGYGTVSGTSFSAPYIAGVAGLLFSHTPTLSVEEAKYIIEYTATRLSTDKPIPSGRVNADDVVVSTARPDLFAVIKAPYDGYLLGTGVETIWGTVLGDSYTLDYQAEGESTWTNISTGTETINGTLGTLDMATVPSGETFFTLRLTATSGTTTDTHSVVVSRPALYESGFPLSLSASGIDAPVTTANLDADSDLEMVVGTIAGKVYVVDEDGTVKTGWPKTMAKPYIYGAPAVGNIDADSDPEIVVTTYGTLATGGSIVAYNTDGTVVTGWPKSLGSMRGGATLANMDSDSELEIIVNSTSSASAVTSVYNGNGTAVTGWPYTYPVNNIQSTPAVGDVDNDGDLEVVTEKYCDINVFNSNGTVMTTITFGSGSSCSHGDVILSDLDGNNDLEIILPTKSGVKVYEHTGTLKWSTSYGLTGGGYDKASAGDIDGDGKVEIFAGAVNAANQSTIFAYNASGTALTGWPKTVTGQIGGEPIIADVTGDGVPDVTVTTEGGRVYAYEADGSLASGFPKATGSPMYRAVNIADRDNDGGAEMIAGTEDGTVHVWDLESTYSFNDTDWPSSRYDATNSGRNFQWSTVVDTTAPTVSVSSPAASTYLTGVAAVSAAATDDTAVTQVDFYLDGTTLIGSDTTSPYGVSWDSTTATAGAHGLTAKAYDAVGNVGTSSSVSVTVDRTAPTAALTAPAAGATLSGTVAVSGTATDAGGIAKVEFYDGATLLGTDTSSPYSVNWDTTAATIGSHSLTLKAYDTAGNTTTTSARSVTVKDQVAPTVSVTSPADGTHVAKKAVLTLTASATDNVGVSKVEFYVGGVLKCTDTTSAYTCSWTAPNTVSTQLITAKSYDAAANVTTSSTVTVYVGS
jgi:subtilisin family serine protease